MKTALQGKIALVTGASGGIGAAICKSLADSDATVVLHCRSHVERARSIASDIERGGGHAFILSADLGSPDNIEKMLADLDTELMRRTGEAKFDILINNAGVGGPASIEETTEEFFDHIMTVNFKAPFFLIQKALPRLRDGGRIISISSAASMRARPRLPIYGASKAALNSLTKTLASYLGKRRITVNAIAPGMVDTEMNKVYVDEDPKIYQKAAMKVALGRVGNSKDIASIVLFLASESGGWINGQIIGADGGQEL